MFLLTKPNILNEEYFGDNDALKRMEKALEQMKRDVNEKGSKYDAETTKEYKILKEGICEVFGFEDVIVRCKMGYDFAIFTIPLSNTLTYIATADAHGKTITKNKYGMCFTKQTGMIAYFEFDISVMATNRCDISAKEMLAIILHEIGHNFFATNQEKSFLCILSLLRGMLVSLIHNIKNPVAMQVLLRHSLIIIFGSKVTYKWYNTAFNYINELTSDLLIRKLYVTLKALAKKLIFEGVNIFSYCTMVVCLLFLPSVWVGQLFSILGESLFNLLTFGWLDTVLVGYDNEKFADNFAASYGYGSELSTGLAKIEAFGKGNHASTTLKKLMEKDSSGMLQMVIAIVGLPNAVCSHALLDCHPNTEQRILNQTKLLKGELKKNKHISPKTKKKLLEDIKEMEKVEQEYFYANEGKDNPFQKSRKESSRATMAYNGDYREVIRGVADKEYEEWEQYQTARDNHASGLR